MLSLLRHPPFARLWSATLISRLGDMALVIALPFYVYDLTGSTLASGALLIAETLPRFLLGSFAGVFVDRWDRRRTMVAADLARAAVLLPPLVVDSAETLWVVYAVGVAQAAIGQFFEPARGALLPRLVARRDLVAANALHAQVDATVRLAGPLVGGALLALLGLSGLILVDSVTFLASAALVALIAVPPAPDLAPGELRRPTGPRPGALVDEWRAGLSTVAADPILAATLVVVAAVSLADGVEIGRAACRERVG